MLRSIGALLFALLLGCDEPGCPPGAAVVEGVCALADAGPAVLVTLDAGPCGGRVHCEPCAADVDCAGDAAFCDPRSLTCVQCTASSQCTEEGAGVCHAVTRTCVECVSDFDCSGDQSTCDLSSGSCVECVADDDCDAGVCDNLRQTCVECLAPGDCASGLCDATSSQCVECLSDGDCVSGFCEQGSNTCVECLSPSHCTDSAAAGCHPTRFECGACTQRSDCASVSGLPACDLASGTCRACTPESQLADCPGTSCDPATFSCGPHAIGSRDIWETCVSDSDCGEGSGCVRPDFLGPSVAVCMPLDDGACPVHPMIIGAHEATSLNGVTADYCMPRPWRSSYEGFRLVLRHGASAATPESCSSNFDCPTGTTCRLLGRHIAGVDRWACTMDCENVFECPLAHFGCDLQGGTGSGTNYRMCGGGAW